MGQYRFSIYAKFQLGLLVRVDRDFLEINIAFFQVLIGLQKQAYGVYLFGWAFTL